jgi:hypothetical protein
MDFYESNKKFIRLRPWALVLGLSLGTPKMAKNKSVPFLGGKIAIFCNLCIAKNIFPKFSKSHLGPHCFRACRREKFLK